MSTLRVVKPAFRGSLIAFAALLSLSSGCADSTRPVEPPVVGGPAPQPPPPPPAGPTAPSGENIYIANADGSAPARLTAGSRPAWAPDGRTIAFNRRESADRRTIWVMPATGGSVRPLVPDGYDAAWSPDGARLAFVSTRAR